MIRINLVSKKLKQRAASRRWYAKNKHGNAAKAARWREKYRGNYLKARWRRQGMSPDAAAWIMQRVKSCEICERTIDLVPDHSHETNTVRGVLCGRCNRAIGLLQDRPDLLRAAAQYLETQLQPIEWKP